MTGIFITYAISAHKKTEEDILRDYNVHKALNPKRETISLDAFREHQKYLHKDKYEIEAVSMGFYTNVKEAGMAIRTNEGNIYRNGAYPYAALLGVKEGVPFARQMATPDNVILYKWNGKDGYDTLDKETDEYKDNNFGRILKEQVRDVVVHTTDDYYPPKEETK